LNLETIHNLRVLTTKLGFVFLGIGCLTPFIALGLLVVLATLSNLFETNGREDRHSAGYDTGQTEFVNAQLPPTAGQIRKQNIWSGTSNPRMTMDQLSEAYSNYDNLDQFDAQVVEIEGAVYAKTRISVTLKDSLGAYLVECFFDPQAYGRIASANEGDNVIIAGQMRVRNLKPEMHDCVFRRILAGNS